MRVLPKDTLMLLIAKLLTQTQLFIFKVNYISVYQHF